MVECTNHLDTTSSLHWGIFGAKWGFHLVLGSPVVGECTLFFHGFAIHCGAYSRVLGGMSPVVRLLFARLGLRCMFAENMEAEQMTKKV